MASKQEEVFQDQVKRGKELTPEKNLNRGRASYVSATCEKGDSEVKGASRGD